MDTIKRLYEHYFGETEACYLIDNGEYDKKIFHDLFSRVGDGQIEELFVFMMAQEEFDEDEIKLMISLGVDVNKLDSRADNLLTTALIDNLVCLVDHCQMASWKFVDKNIKRFRITNFLDSCNDTLFQILLNTGLSFEDILTILLPGNMGTGEEHYFQYCLSGKTIDYIIEKTLLYGHDVDSILLSKLLYYLMLSEKKILTLDNICQFLQFGVDPHYNNDAYFLLSCKKSSPDTVLFFVNECGCNINAAESDALCRAWHYCPSNVKLLLELGVKIDNNVVKRLNPAIGSSFFDLELIDLMVKYGANVELIANKIIGSIEKKKLSLSILKKLIDFDVDLNKIISEYN